MKTPSDPENHPRMEFHRHAAALLPEAKDGDPGVAVMAVSEKTGTASFTCNCRNYRACKTCNHIKIMKSMTTAGDVLEIDRRSRKSVWYQMAGVLNDLCRLNPSDITVERPDPENPITDELPLMVMGDTHGKRVEYADSAGSP
ncbi:MAG: hypothetical protein Q7U02_11200, partial [Desulfosalsimonadaceae bacterium]|nr:hypothetical protein [Desulfosalsimonadaceae bacterium]